MAAREAVRLINETVYGTYATLNAATAAIIHLRDGNQQTVREKPLRWRERSAAGSNRPTYQGSKQVSVEGALQTDMFPSQAGLLLPLACNIALSGAGSLAVWDLPSFSMEHKILHDDMTSASYKRAIGCKVRTLDLTASSQVSGHVARLNMGIVAQKMDATFVEAGWIEPTFATTPGYPLDDPFVFQDLAGQMIVNVALAGVPVPRAGFRDLKLSVKNDLMTPFDEGKHIRRAHWAGREITLEMTLAYTSELERDAYIISKEFPVSFSFNDGVKIAKFDLLGRVFIENLDDDLPLAGEGFYQKITMMPLLDTSLGTPNDLVVTLSNVV